MGYTKRDIRTFSMLGQQGSVGLALSNAKKSRDNLLVMSADLCATSGLSRFQHSYPNDFINVGIAEQNMVGMASGLAACGYKVFASSFSNFIAMRAVEFVRSSVAYMNLDVKLIGIGSGFAMGQFGNTHYGLEDVAMMSAIPGMTIIEPADGLEAAKAVDALLELEGPAYLRLTGTTGSPIVYKDDYDFSIGTAYQLHEGQDALILGSGSIISEAVSAADNLEAEGINVEVINLPTVFPLNKELIKEKCQTFREIFVLEEHGVGGLFSIVSRIAVERCSACSVYNLGTIGKFLFPGTPSYLRNVTGVSSKEIEEKVKDSLFNDE